MVNPENSKKMPKKSIFLYSNLKLTTSSRFFRFSYRKIISGTCTDELSWRNSYGPRLRLGPQHWVSPKKVNPYTIQKYTIFEVENLKQMLWNFGYFIVSGNFTFFSLLLSNLEDKPFFGPPSCAFIKKWSQRQENSVLLIAENILRKLFWKIFDCHGLKPVKIKKLTMTMICELHPLYKLVCAAVFALILLFERCLVTFHTFAESTIHGAKRYEWVEVFVVSWIRK